MTINQSSLSCERLAPELLAPAGNWECARAAVENGANAIYFGLQEGFNARARADNFSLEDLPRLMEMLHHRGVLGYVTLNTLIFTDELSKLEASLRTISQSGVDAVLIQDLGGARLVREVCPDLPIHASTQMTMTCSESIEVIRSLGIERVVLARELSIKEIAAISRETSMPLEVFVHGALCVAYSGQCLTSESLGGRSANRGQCAQACRLPYDLICDGKTKELGEAKYLLSPQDLAGYEHVPELIDAGVCSLKIEGRLKTPEYVANIVRNYRNAIDQSMRGEKPLFSQTSKREMELSFSRGFSPGWLEGNNHKRLVPATSSAKRGVRIGEVIQLRGERLEVALDQPVQSGDGIVFAGDRTTGTEFGGRIYQVYEKGKLQPEPRFGRVELCFQRGLLKGKEIYPGQSIYLTDDPRLTKRLRGSYEVSEPIRKVSISVRIKISEGQPIEMIARCADGVETRLVHTFRPSMAQKHPIDEATLCKQLGRLGGTPYQLESLSASIEGKPMVPLSILGALRRELVTALDRSRKEIRPRVLLPDGATERLLKSLPKVERDPSETEVTRAATLHVLCRSLGQFRASLDAGATDLYADFHDLRDYRHAIADARSQGARIALATLRIHKPGEGGLFLALRKLEPDGWLVRNLAALQFATERKIPFVCDFSLNVTNPLTAQYLVLHGARRVTASYDLNRDQLLELVKQMPSGWLEVVIHQHMPMFHMEHCVFCSVLSPGTNKSNCGRPCDRHEVQLKDRVGVAHLLHADIGCRNTLYNGNAQSGAEVVGLLMKHQVSHFRVELLKDASVEQIRLLIGLYRDLLEGKREGSDVWRTLKAHNRVGVTRGTLEHPRDPMAIL